MRKAALEGGRRSGFAASATPAPRGADKLEAADGAGKPDELAVLDGDVELGIAKRGHLAGEDPKQRQLPHLSQRKAVRASPS